MPSPRHQSESQDPHLLGQPLSFEFSGVVALNRLMKAATTERLASWTPKDRSSCGIPSQPLVKAYKRWGEGGYGLIVSGNIMVAEDHLEAPGNMIIPLNARVGDGEERFEAFRTLANAAKIRGSLFIGQINHPGRQTRLEYQENPVSASAVQLKDTLGMTFGKPHAATAEEIKTIISQFTHSAVYLYEAGFDGIQLHVAHGYLLAQFLTKSTNQRDDSYGGSLENRARIILEIIDSIRQKEGGFSTEEAKELCSILEERAKLDFVELSGGTYESLAFKHNEPVRESTKRREAFFLSFAEQIAPSLHRTKVYVTGGFQTVGGMVEALRSIDGVGIGRAACQEINFGHDIIHGRISGAIEQKIDSQNFMLATIAAGTQIGQIGMDQDPIDLSDQRNVDSFLAHLNTWMEQLKEDKNMTMRGYVDMADVMSDPHGNTNPLAQQIV